jgi:translation machinery-associated protein 16
MPKSFEKARKKIAKKKGTVDAIHEYSRDSKKLHRAHARDAKLEKIVASRKKANQPFSMCLGEPDV